MKVTRDVVSDLWPVYESGEASADTKALVEEFVAGDPAFAATLRGALELPKAAARMSSGAEAQALRRTRDLIYGRGWLRGVRLVALVLTVFAVARGLMDTTWTVSPRVFVGDTIGAIVAWTIYAVALSWQRRKTLRPGNR
jgi:hypothetical protein